MNIPQALSLIAGQPLLVTPAKLQAVTDFLQTRHSFSVDFSGVELNTGEPVLAAEREPNSTGGMYGDDIDVINITGSLVNRAASGTSGMRNYRRIQHLINESVDDRDTGAIFLDMQSSGGMLVGCKRTFEVIRKANEVKPVWAFVDAYAYSACFYLASACERIILADNNCGVGSVGVIAMHLDKSKAVEKEGLNYTVIKAGARKDEYSDLKPLADETLQELQASVDRSRLVFAADVAEARGLSQADVLATEAGCFEGQAAIDIGFADEIAPLEDALGMLAERIYSGSSFYYNNSGSSAEQEGVDFMAEGMTFAQRVGTLYGSNPEEFKKVAEGFGFQSADSVNVQFQDLREEYLAKGEEKGLEAGKKAGLEQAVAVLEKAEIGGASVKVARELVEQGLDAAAAGKRIQGMNAQRSQGELSDSVTQPMTDNGEHPFLSFGE